MENKKLEKETINKIGEILLEINKIKVVLVALWRDEPNIEAQDIINKFKEDIEEIKRGN
jgi:hypothetical protein